MVEELEIVKVNAYKLQYIYIYTHTHSSTLTHTLIRSYDTHTPLTVNEQSTEALYVFSMNRGGRQKKERGIVL